MILCGTKNGSSKASLEEPFDFIFKSVWYAKENTCLQKTGIH